LGKNVNAIKKETMQQQKRLKTNTKKLNYNRKETQDDGKHDVKTAAERQQHNNKKRKNNHKVGVIHTRLSPQPFVSQLTRISSNTVQVLKYASVTKG